MIWMSRIVLIFLITVSAVADLRGAQVQPKLFFSISCIFLGKFGKIVWWPPPPRFEPPPSRNSRSAPGVYVRLTRRRGVCLLSWGLHGDPPQKADPLPPSRTDAPPNTAPPREQKNTFENIIFRHTSFAVGKNEYLHCARIPNGLVWGHIHENNNYTINDQNWFDFVFIQIKPVIAQLVEWRTVVGWLSGILRSAVRLRLAGNG